MLEFFNDDLSPFKKTKDFNDDLVSDSGKATGVDEEGRLYNPERLTSPVIMFG